MDSIKLRFLNTCIISYDTIKARLKQCNLLTQVVGYQFVDGQDKMLPDSVGGDNSDEDFYDAEVLDEMTTRRGELKLRTVSFKEEMLYRVILLISTWVYLPFPLISEN